MADTVQAIPAAAADAANAVGEKITAAGQWVRSGWRFSSNSLSLFLKAAEKAADVGAATVGSAQEALQR